MKIKWQSGPPPGRGTYWIASVFEGVTLVDLVHVNPAFIYRHDPDAPLQIKWGNGLANRFDDFRDSISHHSPVETPEPPDDAAERKRGGR